jgi:phenylalanyl-tRNA synthetase beta chain
MNPLSEDQNVLRTALAPGLLNTLRHNMAQGVPAVRVFELAHIFHADPQSATGARESGRLGILLAGRRHDAWPHDEAELDYQDLKGLVEHLCASFHLQPESRQSADSKHPYLTPAVYLSAQGADIGVMGRVRTDLADACHSRVPVWLAELDMDALRVLCAAVQPRFSALSVFPPVRRDITVIAPATLQIRTVTEHVRNMKLPLLEDISLIDMFTPQGASEHNLTFRMTFRHAGRTLKDNEVDALRERIAASLTQALSVRV